VNVGLTANWIVANCVVLRGYTENGEPRPLVQSRKGETRRLEKPERAERRPLKEPLEQRPLEALKPFLG